MFLIKRLLYIFEQRIKYQINSCKGYPIHTVHIGQCITTLKKTNNASLASKVPGIMVFFPRKNIGILTVTVWNCMQQLYDTHLEMSATDC